MFKKIISAIQWLGRVFVSHAVSAAPVAVTITEGIKAILANPVSLTLENMFDLVTGTNIAVNVAATVNAIIPKILAVELGIEGLADNATPEQILAFEQSVLAAFNVTSNNSKLYTMLGAQIYGILQAAPDTKFATLVDDIEKAYAAYQKDLSANAVPAAAQVQQ